MPTAQQKRDMMWGVFSITLTSYIVWKDPMIVEKKPSEVTIRHERG